MKIIKNSDATNRAIADDTCERIEGARLPGETDDDIILRALHVHSGRPDN